MYLVKYIMSLDFHLQTVFLNDNKKSVHYMSEVALRHRELRTKHIIQKYEENAHKLAAKEVC